MQLILIDFKPKVKTVKLNFKALKRLQDKYVKNVVIEGGKCLLIDNPVRYKIQGNRKYWKPRGKKLW